MRTITFLFSILMFLTIRISAQTYLSDGFEQGLNNWIVSGQDWDTTSAMYRTGGHCATDSKTGNYGPNENASLTLKGTIDLSKSTSPVLTFWHKYDMYPAYDACYVEISTDRGFNWSTLKYYVNTNSSWVLEQIDLSSYVKDTIKIRFRLYSNSDAGYGDGWYIDDVNISDLNSFVKDEIIPSKFALSQNYPNPFNPSTTIEYSIPHRQHVSLKIYDVLGEELETLVNGIEDAGNKSVQWNAKVFPSGVYFYRLQAGSFTQTKKLVLMK